MDEPTQVGGWWLLLTIVLFLVAGMFLEWKSKLVEKAMDLFAKKDKLVEKGKALIARGEELVKRGVK